MDKKIFVLVAGSGSTTGINVIKALQKENISLVGCDCDKYNPSVLFCNCVQVPRCNDINYIKEIIKIIEDFEITHIIPCNDHDLRELSNNIKLLDSKGVFLNGYGVNTLDLLDKKATLNLFDMHNICTPKEILKKDDFPYVLRKEKMGNNKKFVHIVLDSKDLESIPMEHLELGLKTRYVDGIEFTIDIVCDSDHVPIAVVPRERIVVFNGMVHHAKIVKDEILINKIIDLSVKLRLTGIGCIQCIKTIEGEYHFIEINPRPGSGIDLSINGGVNMPHIWIQQTLGMPFNSLEPDWGLNLKRFSDGYFYKDI